MDTSSVDLRTYWLALKAGWHIVLGMIAVCVVCALFLAWPSQPTYASTTRLFIAAGSDTEDLSELEERNAIVAQRLASYVELVRSSSVADAVESATGLEVDGSSVVPLALPGTVVMSVTVTAADAETARDIAAGYAEVLPGAIEELERVREDDSARIRAVVIDEATMPTNPVPTTFRRDLIAAVVLGAGVGVGIAVLRYAITHGGRTRADEPN